MKWRFPNDLPIKNQTEKHPPSQVFAVTHVAAWRPDIETNALEHSSKTIKSDVIYGFSMKYTIHTYRNNIRLDGFPEIGYPNNRGFLK